MKKQAHDNLGAPIQMVDVLSDAFERRVMKNQQESFELEQISFNKYKDDFYAVQASMLK